MATVKKRVISGSALRVASLAIQIGVAMFMVPFMVRALGDRMYGLWTLVGAFMGYYGMLDLGLMVTLDRHVAKAVGGKDHEECNRLLTTGLAIYSFLGLAVLAFVLAVAYGGPMLSSKLASIPAFSSVMLILGVSMALEFPLRSFAGILTANLRFDILVAIQLFSMLLRTVLVVAVLLMGYGIIAVAWVTFLSGLPGKALHIYFCRRILPTLKIGFVHLRKSTAHSLLSFTLFVFVARIADLLRYQTDAFVISLFIGLAAVTHYKIASTLIQYFIRLIMACVGVMLPVFSRQQGAQNLQGMRKMFFMSTRVSVCLSSFVAFGLIAWGHPFILKWMGPRYIDAYPPLVILTLAAVAELWQAPMSQLLLGIGRQKLHAVCAIIDGVLNLLLSLLLVRRLGIVGVALGTMIPGGLIRLGVEPFFACRAAGIPYGAYLRLLARSITNSAGALVLPAILTYMFAAPSYLTLVVLGSLSLGLYLISLWLFEVTPAEAEAFAQAFRPTAVKVKETL